MLKWAYDHAYNFLLEVHFKEMYWNKHLNDEHMQTEELLLKPKF